MHNNASAPLGTSFSEYWSEFFDHWRGWIVGQDGVIVTVVIVGIIAVFIITRGKWY